MYSLTMKNFKKKKRVKSKLKKKKKNVYLECAKKGRRRVTIRIGTILLLIFTI